MVRPPYQVEWVFGTDDDLRHLAAIDIRLGRIGRQVALDVAERHKHGKALGERHVTGGPTGCFRLTFDLPEHRPERFRLVYDRPTPTTIRVIGIGEREGSDVYQTIVQRLRDLMS